LDDQVGLSGRSAAIKASEGVAVVLGYPCLIATFGQRGAGSGGLAEDQWSCWASKRLDNSLGSTRSPADSIRGTSFLAASGVTQYGPSGSGVASKMSNHEDTLASLGRAEVSSVHHPVGPPIPEVFQAPDDGGHVPPGPVDSVLPSTWAGEEADRILDDHPSGLGFVNESEVLSDEALELEVVAAAASGESAAMRCSDGGVLAGESSDGEIGSSDLRACDVTDVS
jgi:hypothetical protein